MQLCVTDQNATLSMPLKSKRKPADSGAQPKAHRQQFTLLPEDVELIEDLRKRYQDRESQQISAYVEVPKSRIVRAGLRALKEMSDAKLQKTINSVEKPPEGRPKRK